MGRKKNSLDDLLNNIQFFALYNQFKNIALNAFQWEGLPEGMKQEYVERTLFYHGKALFFQDPKNGLLCLQAGPGEGMNVYGEHFVWYAIGHNYQKSYDLRKDMAVLIKNNAIMTNTYDFVMLYVNKLVEIERAIDVNVEGQKTPYVLACDDKDLLTMKNIYHKRKRNEPVIFANKNLNLDSLQVFMTPADYVSDKLADLRHDIMNELLTFLGIDNANTDKRERLVTDEVNSNNEFVELNAKYMLETREKAVEEINQKFGLKITVKRREVMEGEPIHTGSTEGSEG